jgi:hypothetical protein
MLLINLINITKICKKKLTAKYFKVFLKVIFFECRDRLDENGVPPRIATSPELSSQSAQSSGAG